MQTSNDSKALAQVKDVKNLFGQSTTFKMSDEAEMGSAAVQPVRNNLMDGNDNAVDKKLNRIIRKSFLSQYLKKPNVSD